MNRFLFILIILSGNLTCATAQKENFKTDKVYPILNSEKLYYKYLISALNYSESAIFKNEMDSIISKKEFFEKVYKESFFPLMAEKSNTYKLIKVDAWPNSQVKEWVKGDAYLNYKKSLIVGKQLLSKEFTSLDGTIFDSTVIKDKLVFVKFWFIACSPCVAEMPALNKIVENNNRNKNIVFLSFAPDSEESLRKFISKTEFKYQIIPVPKSYIIDTIGIVSFPTHLLVKNNKVEKVITADEIGQIIQNNF